MRIQQRSQGVGRCLEVVGCQADTGAVAIVSKTKELKKRAWGVWEVFGGGGVVDAPCPGSACQAR
jgi:hypothetical protein